MAEPPWATQAWGHPGALLEVFAEAPCPKVSDSIAASNWVQVMEEFEALQAVHPGGVQLKRVHASDTIVDLLRELQETTGMPAEVADSYGASFNSAEPPHCSQLGVEMQLLVFPLLPEPFTVNCAQAEVPECCLHTPPGSLHSPDVSLEDCMPQAHHCAQANCACRIRCDANKEAACMRSKPQQAHRGVQVDGIEGAASCTSAVKGEGSVEELHHHNAVAAKAGEGTEGGQRKYRPGAEVVKQLPPVLLSVRAPAAYPSAAGPLIVLAVSWLTVSQLQAVAQQLVDLWSELGPGSPVLLTWLEWLRLELLDFLRLNDGLVLRADVGKSCVRSIGAVQAGCQLARHPPPCASTIGASLRTMLES
jgi:hypothetical protein